MKDDEFALVRGHPLFQGLSDTDTEAILSGASPKTYPKGYVLFTREDPVDYFYFVFGGWVKVYRETIDGGEAVIGIFARGETLAEAMAFIGGHYPASAEVVEEARVLPIRSANFVHYLKENPEVGLTMLSSLSRRMHHLVGEIESLKTRTASQRVAQFLLRLCSTHDGEVVVALPYDKSVISARLGIQPESLSRIFGRLRKYGVTIERERVIIADVALLERYSEGEAVDLH